MDPLAALILTDDDTYRGEAGESKLSQIILLILVPILLAGAISIAKDASIEWRVMNVPSLSATS